ncbi:hypothetical protein E8E13_008625 [Curvularia kusanoi]|uniref:Xylanolytic transcriptional activator regulatory domain-containing protein n=1 Tax=Curvularia kusanoi TaxID=90978 RepID=A0A9P4TFY3_CURKU|nr:hypothetical protein E8E13_008625 [Curvularia kusanoi]
MAEDITILQQYLTSTTIERRVPSKLYSTISTAPGGSPVVYLTVPKRRRGLRNALDPGRAQREIIEQVLGPFAADVRSAYFEHLHPCFPVLDRETFLAMWQTDCDRISPTLVCDLYASALQIWVRSATLCNQPRPDPHFIWNQAVAALQDDFMAPTISTVHAAVLDLLGRPVIGVTGNIVNAGRIVTLAQSLGLHRDPSSWKATEHEKSVRINLWWGVLIHDYWSSIGHGIPPTINPDFHDVPVPKLVSQTINGTEVPFSLQVNDTFMYLCTLSKILGDMLPLVYSLREASEDIMRRLRKIECALDDWEVALPKHLQRVQAIPVITNGMSNLQFAYLSLRVLLCRLYYKAALGSSKKSPEVRQYYLAMLRTAASEVADYIISLTEARLQEFWMPYTSYLLVTSATILLRCTIESNDLITKKGCVAKLVEFRNRLRIARDISQWDLADFCLERCDEPIQKMSDAMGMSPHNMHAPSAVSQAVEPDAGSTQPSTADPFSIDDLVLPIDSLDYPWETLWDGIEGPWSIQI